MTSTADSKRDDRVLVTMHGSGDPGDEILFEQVDNWRLAMTCRVSNIAEKKQKIDRSHHMGHAGQDWSHDGWRTWASSRRLRDDPNDQVQ